MVMRKLELIVDSMPLSDPNISDIRFVRAVDRARMKLISFRPHALYARTVKTRVFHRVWENSFSEPLTKYDANYGRAFLTSKKR